MKRRSLVGGLVGSLAAGLGALVTLSPSARPRLDPAGKAAREAARAVGRCYLRTQPSARQVAALLAGLRPDARLEPIPRGAGLGRAVRDRAVRDDFRNGRVLELDGWIVSHTEVALGLAAVLQPAAPGTATARG